MRNFKNLEKTKQQELINQFPQLLELACAEETTNYKYLAVSIFDHWLTKKEANKLLDNVTREEQKERDNRLYLFSKKLAKETEIINFKFIGKNKEKPIFRSFTSSESKLNYLQPAVNGGFFNIVLPELNAVFFESWDDTNVFYLKDASKVKQIQNWAQDCGVFCLEK